ncbi:MAG TPA: cobalamin-dependent protein, partial [bacterium]|nr:cobalamin-dependent protein [bacterium]
LRGFTKNDFIVDGLVMTVSSNQNAAIEALQTIKWCSESFNTLTILGLSNISFGLPARTYINSAFLAMAANSGLSLTIANPSDEIFMNIKYGADVLTGRDKNSKIYISKFSQNSKDQSASAQSKKTASANQKQELYSAILEGNSDNIAELIKKNLDSGLAANEIVNSILIPAITEVGNLYEKKEYFLPQLISSAEAMKEAFIVLEPYLSRSETELEKQIIVIMATVEGDIHDIGKNIVCVMLKNYGYKVVDLGKNVAAIDIINSAKKYNADFIGLSALMTTTMTQMKNVVDLAKQNDINAKIIIGGAVITQEYCDEIGADGYAQDALAAVKLLDRLLTEENENR